jgi:hypothetical protein
LQRQIRAHYTRADGSLNYSGYFSEILGVSVDTSDFDSTSGDDNGSSGSGSSSAIVAIGSEVTTMEVSSIYQSAKSVAKFRGRHDVSGDFDEDEVVLEPVEAGEYVTFVHTSEPAFFYMYTNFIKDFHLYFPFTEFQLSMLRVLNVAPTQLSPNNWSFIKAFELVCFGLDIVAPSVAVFFSFYQIKKLFPNSVVSLSGQPNRGLFGLYSSNYKNYKDTFVCVRGGDGGRDVMYSSDDDEPLFPFYWTTNPGLIKGAVYERLSEF